MRKTYIYSMLFTLAMIPSTVLRGLVLKLLWGWFLFPWLTPTVPSVILCMGIMTIFSLLTYPQVAEKISKKKSSVSTNLDSVSTKLDIEELFVDETTKRHLRALQELAYMNIAYTIKDTLIVMVTAPLNVLAIGWALKHFLR